MKYRRNSPAARLEPLVLFSRTRLSQLVVPLTYFASWWNFIILKPRLATKPILANFYG